MYILLDSFRVFLEYTEIEQAKERFCWHSVPGAGGEFRKLVNREEIVCKCSYLNIERRAWKSLILYQHSAMRTH